MKKYINVQKEPNTQKEIIKIYSQTGIVDMINYHDFTSDFSCR